VFVFVGVDAHASALTTMRSCAEQECRRFFSETVNPDPFYSILVRMVPCPRRWGALSVLPHRHHSRCCQSACMHMLAPAPRRRRSPHWYGPGCPRSCSAPGRAAAAATAPASLDHSHLGTDPAHPSRARWGAGPRPLRAHGPGAGAGELCWAMRGWYALPLSFHRTVAMRGTADRQRQAYVP